MADLGTAMSLTAVAFEKKKDRGGTPYFLHCMTVMYSVAHLGDEVMQAAVMHDLLEDFPDDWNSGKLIKLGFSPAVVGLVVLLTHLKGETYDDYIMRISVSARARAIKMADLDHNSQIHRMKGLREKDMARLAKYHKAYAFLRDMED